MRKRWSLRAHVFTGAVLWSVGLFLLTSLALVAVMQVHPGAPGHVHSLLGHVWAVSAVALACLGLGLVHVSRGFSAVGRIRRDLTQLHAGQTARLEGNYPAEVSPLVDDVNALLADRDRAIERARARAADLAHGLKTPLAVLQAEADRIGASTDPAIAESIAKQVARMTRQVEYHLALARTAATAPAATERTPLVESLAGLRRALERLHADRAVRIDMEVPDTCHVRLRRADLDDIFGNLLDNAYRWARTRITIRALSNAGAVVCIVDDDGEGLSPAMYGDVLRRGVRADESGEGSGLGLSIAKDLAECAGGTLALEPSPLGGLRVTVTLPASAAGARPSGED